MGVIDADYLVVGAGATGMAFTDALIEHADVSVALVDRRPSVGGHWLDDYSFVRLHQPSSYYGVPSTMLGDGRLQTEGPEAGLQERATAPEVCAYFRRVLERRLVASGKVTFYPSCDYVGDRTLVSRLSGKRFEVSERCRIVNACYIAPTIPATTAPPFGVAVSANVVPVNDLVRLVECPSQYVIAGSGKTATDAVVWLLENGVDPDAICWVRPREPWMYDRAVLQPDPAIFFAMAADTMQAAIDAKTPDELFLNLEAAGVMVRIDESVTPTMAKTPTLGRWELERLRTVENVVRLGHITSVEKGRVVLERGEVAVDDKALIVHCAASGLTYRPLVPIWDADAITLQPVRTGLTGFGAAVIGYVEATRDNDEDKNRVCKPTPLSNTPQDWALMQAVGSRASMALSSAPDIKAWGETVALNPSRVQPGTEGRPELTAALSRFKATVAEGMAQMMELAQSRL